MLRHLLRYVPSRVLHSRHFHRLTSADPSLQQVIIIIVIIIIIKNNSVTDCKMIRPQC